MCRSLLVEKEGGDIPDRSTSSGSHCSRSVDTPDEGLAGGEGPSKTFLFLS